MRHCIHIMLHACPATLCVIWFVYANTFKPQNIAYKPQLLTRRATRALHLICFVRLKLIEFCNDKIKLYKVYYNVMWQQSGWHFGDFLVVFAHIHPSIHISVRCAWAT